MLGTLGFSVGTAVMAMFANVYIAMIMISTMGIVSMSISYCPYALLGQYHDIKEVRLRPQGLAGRVWARAVTGRGPPGSKGCLISHSPRPHCASHKGTRRAQGPPAALFRKGPLPGPVWHRLPGCRGSVPSAACPQAPGAPQLAVRGAGGCLPPWSPLRPLGRASSVPPDSASHRGRSTLQQPQHKVKTVKIDCNSVFDPVHPKHTFSTF